MLSNVALIREFITQSIQKKEVLLANSSLQAQMVYKSNQLIAKKEGIIATTQLNSESSDFLIASPSSYWDVINEILADYTYICTGEINKLGLYKYQQCSIPQGYELRCTTSVNLWQNWWKYRKKAFNPGIPLDILIRTRDSWYGVKDLFISDGLIYIKTLVSEISVHSNDLVIWLSKTQPDYPA